ncbi:hypothetical protein SDC9_30494 [bioreactor metagenome]|uniref:HNH nuclease domain-containing protein n=1 Tax=bioreactor metagenome TaxID=1076179 RepID=A0A644UZL3_9ZZZZ|nr:HNH endonuclease [Methanobrevibacter sp.]MEA4957571.1 HNH endonuclease [Methanobrevibacter sp.]
MMSNDCVKVDKELVALVEYKFGFSAEEIITAYFKKLMYADNEESKLIKNSILNRMNTEKKTNYSRDQLQRVVNKIKDYNEPVHKNMLIGIMAKEMDIGIIHVEKLIKQLKAKGVIFEPTRDSLQIVDNFDFFENKKVRKTLTKSIRHEVFKRDNYRCVECGATNKDTVLHIDHIIPFSKGGSDELDNLQTLCESCNISKSNRYWKGGYDGEN